MTENVSVLTELDASVENLSDSEGSDETEKANLNSQPGHDAAGSQEAARAPPLNADILNVLRANTAIPKEDCKIHDTLVDCWNRILREDLRREERMEIMEKYFRKGNCHLEDPLLNEEVNSFIHEKIRKRDGFFVLDQNIAGTGLSALGTVLSMIFWDEDAGVDKLKLLELLNDAGWMIAELFHLLTIARRSYLSFAMDRKMKAILDKSKADEWLFDSELAQKIKAA